MGEHCCGCHVKECKEEKKECVGISADMKISEVLDKCPSAAEILMNEGVHCVGCHAAQWESLEDGLKSHGKSEEEIKQIIDKINKVVEEESNMKYFGNENSILITERALSELKDKVEEGKFLRVEVSMSGCSGFQFGLSITDEKDVNDEMFEIDGLKILVGKEVLGFVAGTKLDFSPEKDAFKFIASMPSGGCCGC